MEGMDICSNVLMFDVGGLWSVGRGRADRSWRVAGRHPSALGLFRSVSLNLRFSINFFNFELNSHGIPSGWIMNRGKYT